MLKLSWSEPTWKPSFCVCNREGLRGKYRIVEIAQCVLDPSIESSHWCKEAHWREQAHATCSCQSLFPAFFFFFFSVLTVFVSLCSQFWVCAILRLLSSLLIGRLTLLDCSMGSKVEGFRAWSHRACTVHLPMVLSCFFMMRIAAVASFQCSVMTKAPSELFF